MKSKTIGKTVNAGSSFSLSSSFVNPALMKCLNCIIVIIFIIIVIVVIIVVVQRIKTNFQKPIWREKKTRD